MIASKKLARGCCVPLYSSPLGCEIGNFCRLLSAAVRTVEPDKLSEILTVEFGSASPSAAAVLLSVIIVGMNPDIQYDLTLLRELDHVHMGGLYRRVPHDRH
jgi:hypothetical protein